MSRKKDNMYSGTLKKDGDRLVYLNTADEKIFKLFKDSLDQGQLVDVFFDAQTDDGSLPQIAKIYKCIREIAKETGEDFEDMKLLVKKKAGLCMKKEVEGEVLMYCKSFGKASKDELSMVIETIIKIGDLVGVNCR